MSQHGKKQQERLARKKAQRERKKAAIARRVEHGELIPIEYATDWPVFEASVPDNLFAKGIGNLFLARRMPNGRLAVGIYLLDTYCLGVKDFTLGVVSPAGYRLQVAQADAVGRQRPTSPERFAKLILDGVAYARGIGLEPHPDFELGEQLLAGINAAACTDTFEFGSDGKPLYIQGPNDGPARIAQIMTAIQPVGGFGTFMGVPPDWDDIDESEEEQPLALPRWSR
jgi:hypothetical protein